MTKPNIIGICGFKGSGKDTLARQIQAYGYEHHAFADTLKDVLSMIFGWDRDMLEGETVESRLWREEPDTWWEHKLNWFDMSDDKAILQTIFPRFTPRAAMQLFGTNLFRKHFNDSIWVLSLENRIKNSEYVVISDCRFHNEIKMIKDCGGKLIKIDRGERPDWYSVGVDAANGNTSARDYLISKKIHISEWSWLNQDFDIEIKNDNNPVEMFNIVKSKFKL